MSSGLQLNPWSKALWVPRKTLSIFCGNFTWKDPLKLQIEIWGAFPGETETVKTPGDLSKGSFSGTKWQFKVYVIKCLFLFYIKGEYAWIRNSKPVKYSKSWAKGQPDNFGKNEDCIHLWSGNDFKWNDYDCSMTKGKSGKEFRALCQRFWKNDK